MDRIAENLRKFRLQGLVVIGGFEAFQSVLMMYEARSAHPEFRIPMVRLPQQVEDTQTSFGCTGRAGEQQSFGDVNS